MLFIPLPILLGRFSSSCTLPLCSSGGSCTMVGPSPIAFGCRCTVGCCADARGCGEGAGRCTTPGCEEDEEEGGER